jgi:hypothetical protein
MHACSSVEAMQHTLAIEPTAAEHDDNRSLLGGGMWK